MDLYKTLGIERGASSGEIKKAYMKLAKTEHPDKGGNEESFKKIVKAYEVLSDDEKRTFYDQTGQIAGEGGVPEGAEMGGMNMGGMNMGGGMPFPFGGMGGFTMNMGDLFGMFGGRQGSRKRERQGKEPPKVKQVPVSLSQFYHGHRFGVEFDRYRFCSKCTGTGADKTEDCRGCHGSGVQTKIIQMGPGMMMQSQGPCDQCQGKGKKQTGTCSECKGVAKFMESKKLEVRIVPGMSAGETVIFNNVSSDTHEFAEAGDLHIVFENSEDLNDWARNGSDLEKTVTISYTESLLGTTVKLLGHPRAPAGLYVDIPAVTINGDVLVVKNEGMPIKNTGRFGSMKLKIQIKVTDEERAAITSADTAQIASAAGISQFVKASEKGTPHITAGSISRG
jgi:DnaJ-class molecular chaperone